MSDDDPTASPQALSSTYDLAMLDLDGVVYIGGEAVPGAAARLAKVREAGMRCAFITNNASRPPEAVADHLTSLGVECTSDDVVTSAQAAARVLRERLGAGAAVVLLGGEGLEQALRAQDLVPVGVEDDAEAIASGYGPDLVWRDLMRAAVRIRDGLWWVASNTDQTIPTAYGVAPGHGVLVDTLRRFADVEPVVAGKPERPLLDETMRRMEARRPLMVGDRLDTDIEGASNAGVDSLLVLTGVTGLAELVAARPHTRPTYVAPDLEGLLSPPRLAERGDAGWTLGGWTVSVDDGDLAVSGSGDVADWWPAVAAAAWAHLDDTDSPAGTDGLEIPGSLAP